MKEEEVTTDPDTGGQKGVKPARFDLIPARPIRQIAEVFGFGADKYAPRNWEKGYKWSLSFGALNRHLWSFWEGDETDPESGLPHLAHAAFHILALLQFSETHRDKDDRSKPREPKCDPSSKS